LEHVCYEFLEMFRRSLRSEFFPSLFPVKLSEEEVRVEASEAFLTPAPHQTHDVEKLFMTNNGAVR
jgi:hypothetical protein